MAIVLLLIISIHVSFCSLPNRPDSVQELITSNEDGRGDWSTTIYCNDDEYAIGYDLKVQGQMHLGDDTAANSLRLKCSDLETLISDREGEKGDWSSVDCLSNSYITSYRTKIESAQGAGDDTSLNSVSAICNDQSSTIIETSNAQQWGTWSNYVNCSYHSAVCGFRQNVQSDQKGGDDSALQAVRFQCCSLPTMNPTTTPSNIPSISPSFGPTIPPSIGPSYSTIAPTNFPSISPTNNPSLTPSMSPSHFTKSPTYVPSVTPSVYPTITPTYNPTISPTDVTFHPTNDPTEPEGRTDLIKSTNVILESTDVIGIENKLNEKKNSATVIILVVLGIFVLLLILGFFGCFYTAWRKSKMEKEVAETEPAFVTSIQSHSNISSISREEQKQSELDVDFKVMRNSNHMETDAVNSIDDDDDDDDDDIIKYCNNEITQGFDNMEEQMVDTESEEMVMDLRKNTHGELVADDAFIVQDDEVVAMNKEGLTPQTPMNDEIIDNGDTVH